MTQDRHRWKMFDDEGDEYLVCDWCGHECQDFTSFFGDIRCDECAYEDETYRREILGEDTSNRPSPA